jgi:hypothetical protein
MMAISDEGREALRDEGLRRYDADRPAIRDDSFFPTPGLPTQERVVVDEDTEREGLMGDLMDEPARPLTHDEREVAEHDPGRPERVYAPASARVPKEPAPGDDRLISGR